ncbi:uncharacterized protein [Anoplolepis gracilipes]|uniref:uncharacterized protein n=1 Tax=Anoplolepis gracilipes TaxID=354296 RepID=UPI003BA1A212
MGLEVTLSKTEAIWFAPVGKREPPRDKSKIEIEGVVVEVGIQLKYLGLILDSRWSFGPLLEKLAPRVRAFCLFGPPGGSGPGNIGIPATKDDCKAQAPGSTTQILEWEEDLSNTRTGLRAAEAIRPIFIDWVDRRHGALDFRTVQVLTGHGCFGKYLHRIDRKRSAASHHCGASEDTAEHTLAECQAWEDQRRVLRDAIGEEVSLAAMMKAMVTGEDQWRAAATFCGDVMSRKEAAERERETDPRSRVTLASHCTATHSRGSVARWSRNAAIGAAAGVYGHPLPPAQM